FRRRAGRAGLHHVALVVAAQDRAAQRLCQTPACGRVGRADHDIAGDDQLIDMLPGHMVERGLEGGQVAVNIGQNGDTGHRVLQIRWHAARMLIAPLVFALSIAIAAWDADLAKWSWLLITVISLA